MSSDNQISSSTAQDLTSVLLQNVTSKGRNNHSKNFFIRLRDLKHIEDRDVATLVTGVIEAINKHKRRTSTFDETVYIFNLSGTDQYAIYLQCSGQDTRGFVRSYFSDARAFGAVCLKTLGLELIDQKHGPSARG